MKKGEEFQPPPIQSLYEEDITNNIQLSTKSIRSSFTPKQPIFKDYKENELEFENKKNIFPSPLLTKTTPSYVTSPTNINSSITSTPIISTCTSITSTPITSNYLSKNTSIYNYPPSSVSNMSNYSTNIPSFTNYTINNDCWVTVFGFLPSNLQTILKHFSMYGKIINYIQGNGNWVHLQYENKIQAQNALTKNGKIIDQTLMIGVVPCTEKAIITNPSLNNNPLLPIKSDIYHPQNASYAVQSPYPPNVPISQNSFFSKIMEYIFGN